uniref:Uncharacterized protein n=1 Tax=Acrobeloides nanus TaxID=290746 RepID=A0A914BYB8_9BILA
MRMQTKVKAEMSAVKRWLRLILPLKRQLTVFILPIILLPLPLFLQSKEAKCAYVVLYMAYLWMTETLPLAITALIPIMAYPLLGIDSASHISSVYLSDVNFVFVGSLILAIAVEVSHLHERIALRILLFTGSNPRWLMLGFQLATCLLSMWISNTATTAMMVPILLAVIGELENCKRKNTDDLESNDKSTTPAAFGAIKFTREDMDASESKERNVYKGLLLSVCFSASIGGTGTLIGTGPNLIMYSYLEKNYGHGVPITFATWMLYSLPQLIVMIIFEWLWLQLLFIGFRNTTDRDSECAVHETLRKKYENLGTFRYDECTILVNFVILVILWLFRQPKFIPGWGELFEPGYVSDGTVAMGMALILFVLPAENPFKVRKTSGEYKPILEWKDMRERFSWSTVLLLGGGYAMAAGVEKSGLSDFVGRELSQLEFLPEWIFVCLACLIVMCLTEVSSNVATSSIFVPLVASIARAHKTNPLLYILPTTLSCSFAFMFPAGTPPNAIVFSSGFLKVFDMVGAL